MRILSSAFACLLLIVTAAAAARAQEPGDGLYGQTVVTVRFEVEGRADTSPSLFALVDVAAGKVLTRPDVRSSMERLIAVGRFEDASAVAVAAPGGVDVTFRLTPRHVVNQLEVTGESGLPASDLRRRLLDYYGGVPSNQRTSDVEQTALQILNDEGFLDATVTASVAVRHDPEGADLVVAATAGSRVPIASVDVQGASPFSPEEIGRRAGVEAGQPFRRRQIQAALSGIEDVLRARNYYEAELTLQTSRSAAGVDVRILVAAGPLVELRVSPPGALPGDVDALIPVRRERSADVDLLEDAKANIERLLKDQGYATARATFSRSISDDGARLVVAFDIARGPLHVVERVEIPDGLVLPADRLREILAIDPGDAFDERQFVGGLARVVQEYLGRGYYRAEAIPAKENLPTVNSADPVRVVLHPQITEGPRALTSAVTFSFVGTHVTDEATLRGVMRSRNGDPYVAAHVAEDRAILQSFYLERGFLNAAVAISPSFAEDGRAATVAVTVNEGAQVRIAEITIVGADRVAESVIREELGLAVGQPLSDTELRAARQRLAEMSVFSRVTISVADRLGNDTGARVVVSVVEASATTLGIGGGLEGQRVSYNVDGETRDQIEFVPRGFFEIGRQNIGGRNRSLNFFSRLSIRPGDSESTEQSSEFTEYRASLAYRERRAFRTNSELLFAVSSERARRTSFDFSRRAANAEIFHRPSPTVGISGRYVLDFTELFDEEDIPSVDRPIIDRVFPQVRLSTVATGISWDRRDSPLNPTRGALVTGDIEVAARALASEVGFVKTFFQASHYRRLDDSARTVAAIRAQLGLARGFTRSAPLLDETGNPVLDPNGDPVLVPVRDLPISQRFFAGGGTTVRGFQIDRLGRPDVFAAGGVPVGGNGLLIFNAELRRVVRQFFGYDFGVVGFLDAGNVFLNASDIDLQEIRGTAGFGVRWDLPAAPIRMDFGFKMTRELINEIRESGWEYHLSIGQAF